MARRLFVATRKGLFRLERGVAAWQVEVSAHLPPICSVRFG